MNTYVYMGRASDLAGCIEFYLSIRKSYPGRRFPPAGYLAMPPPNIPCLVNCRGSSPVRPRLTLPRPRGLPRGLSRGLPRSGVVPWREVAEPLTIKLDQFARAGASQHGTRGSGMIHLARRIGRSSTLSANAAWFKWRDGAGEARGLTRHSLYGRQYRRDIAGFLRIRLLTLGRFQPKSPLGACCLDASAPEHTHTSLLMRTSS